MNFEKSSFSRMKDLVSRLKRRRQRVRRQVRLNAFSRISEMKLRFEIGRKLLRLTRFVMIESNFIRLGIESYQSSLKPISCYETCCVSISNMSSKRSTNKTKLKSKYK